MADIFDEIENLKNEKEKEKEKGNEKEMFEGENDFDNVWGERDDFDLETQNENEIHIRNVQFDRIRSQFSTLGIEEGIGEEDEVSYEKGFQYSFSLASQLGFSHGFLLAIAKIMKEKREEIEIPIPEDLQMNCSAFHEHSNLSRPSLLSPSSPSQLPLFSSSPPLSPSPSPSSSSSSPSPSSSSSSSSSPSIPSSPKVNSENQESKKVPSPFEAFTWDGKSPKTMDQSEKKEQKSEYVEGLIEERKKVELKTQFLLDALATNDPLPTPNPPTKEEEEEEEEEREDLRRLKLLRERVLSLRE